MKLWFSWNVLSRIIFRHHNIATKIIKIKFNIIKGVILKFKIIILDIIKLNVFIDIMIGHGFKFKIK